MAHSPVDYFVLDSLASDIESIEDVLRILNSDSILGWRDQHPEPFTRDEIVPSLLRAIGRGEVRALIWEETARALVDAGAGVIPPGSLDDVWFHLTARGRVVHQSWDPPTEPPA